MGLADQMVTDLRNAFFNPNDFAVAVTYTPASGTAYSLQGIFDKAYQEMDPDTEVSVSGTLPAVRVMTMDLRATPSNNDHVTIDGVVYRVRDYQPDGTGTARILLTQE